MRRSPSRTLTLGQQMVQSSSSTTFYRQSRRLQSLYLLLSSSQGWMAIARSCQFGWKPGAREDVHLLSLKSPVQETRRLLRQTLQVQIDSGTRCSTGSSSSQVLIRKRSWCGLSAQGATMLSDLHTRIQTCVQALSLWEVEHITCSIRSGSRQAIILSIRSS